MVSELMELATMIQNLVLQEGQPDTIAWRFTQDHEYSARSAYRLQFVGSTTMEGHKLIWSGWAPNKCCFFIWTVMLGRILTVDALLCRGWENDYFYPLCERSLETPSHLFIECPWSRTIWDALASLADMPAIKPANWMGDTKFATWMQSCYDAMTKEKRKGIISLVQLITWEIWKERNRRVFQKELMTMARFSRLIRDEIRLWNMAGARIPFDPG